MSNMRGCGWGLRPQHAHRGCGSGGGSGEATVGRAVGGMVGEGGLQPGGAPRVFWEGSFWGFEVLAWRARFKLQ